MAALKAFRLTSFGLFHPHIITIYDIVEENGTDFIVMEYVQGKTLDQVIGRKGLRVNEALKYAIQIADGLAKAHSAGIVHRDLKPSNVMVATYGHVKILDFGLAKLTEHGTGGSAKPLRFVRSNSRIQRREPLLAPQAEDRERNRPICSANFMIAGLLYEGRASIVDRYLRVGQRAYLARDPDNAFDENAIEIRVAAGYQIGYVPREYATRLAPLLDGLCRHAAYCTKILQGRRAPIPVIQARLYRADAEVTGTCSVDDVPGRASPPTPKKAMPGLSSCGCIVAVTAALLFLLLFAVLSR